VVGRVEPKGGSGEEEPRGTCCCVPAKDCVSMPPPDSDSDKGRESGDGGWCWCWCWCPQCDGGRAPSEGRLVVLVAVFHTLPADRDEEPRNEGGGGANMSEAGPRP
jgi:hypothetical protein